MSRRKCKIKLPNKAYNQLKKLYFCTRCMIIELYVTVTVID